MSNELNAPNAETDETPIVKKRLTWAEWSIIVAFFCIATAFFYGWHAQAVAATAEAKLKKITETTNDVQTDLDRILKQLDTAKTELDRKKAELAANQKANESTAARIEQLEKEKQKAKADAEIAGTWRIKAEMWKNYADNLEQFLNKHESTRWFTLSGRPRRPE